MNDPKKPSAFVDLDDRALDALMERIAEAREHSMALSPDDYDLLASALTTLATLQERISHSDLTILKLRKLLGMVNSSEALDRHHGKAEQDKNKDKNPDRDTEPNMSG